jgi:hypothetical protein
MTTVSTIEIHERRAEIELDLARGMSVRKVAEKYKVSKDAAQRHKATIPASMKAAAVADMLRPGADIEELYSQESRGLLGNILKQRGRLMRLQDEADDEDDANMVRLLATEIRKNLELSAKLHGQIQQHIVTTHVNLLVQPEYLQFRAGILHILRGFPEARAALSEFLHRSEDDLALPTTIEGEVHG